MVNVVMMHKDLDAEKTAQTKFWARREKQIEVIKNTTAILSGEIEGILDSESEAIQLEELPINATPQTAEKSVIGN